MRANDLESLLKPLVFIWSSLACVSCSTSSVPERVYSFEESQSLVDCKNQPCSVTVYLDPLSESYPDLFVGYLIESGCVVVRVKEDDIDKIKMSSGSFVEALLVKGMVTSTAEDYSKILPGNCSPSRYILDADSIEPVLIFFSEPTTALMPSHMMAIRTTS